MKGEKIKFNLCIGVDELINFIDINSDLEWNDICDMEYKYRKSKDFENDRAYPIIILGEYEIDEFHKWCEKFINQYKDEIGNRTVYIIHD
jgi:hypothetical protein